MRSMVMWHMEKWPQITISSFVPVTSFDGFVFLEAWSG